MAIKSQKLKLFLGFYYGRGRGGESRATRPYKKPYCITASFLIQIELFLECLRFCLNMFSCFDALFQSPDITIWLENSLATRHAHMAGNGGFFAAPFNGKVMAFGFAAYGFINGGIKQIIAL